jgi:hypothetical protein
LKAARPEFLGDAAGLEKPITDQGAALPAPPWASFLLEAISGTLN